LKKDVGVRGDKSMNKIKDFFRNSSHARSLKYGSNSVILSISVITIVILINIMLSPDILERIIGKGLVRFDLTSNKLYSIGDISKNILDHLEKDVEIYGLFEESVVKIQDSAKNIDYILSQYRKNPHIKVKYFDPDLNPGFIKQIDPDNMKGFERGDYMVKCGNNLRRIIPDELYSSEPDPMTGEPVVKGTNAENAFTSAINYVTSDKIPVIYFLDGHGEKNILTEYRLLSGYLGSGYNIKTANIALTGGIPDDASALAVLSPKRDLAVAERGIIDGYLQDGGNLLLLFDPQESDAKLTGFEQILSEYGMTLGYDIIRETDPERFNPKNPYEIMVNIAPSAVNNNLAKIGLGILTVPKAMSISKLNIQKNGLTVDSVIFAASSATSEKLDKSAEQPGGKWGYNLALASEYKGNAKPSKIIVVGNSEFVSDRYMSQASEYGVYFIVNALNWLAGNQEPLAITPKSLAPQMLVVTEAQANISAVFMTIIIPLLILSIGAIVWMRRRHL
jgi:hypothetical protein